MITRNLKALLSVCLQSSTNVMSFTRAVSVNGDVYYLSNNFAFPASRTETYTLTNTAAGVSFGTGTKSESAEDYQLQNTITSGINVVLTSRETYFNEGKPSLLYRFTITNTSGNSITITEVGYKQTVKGSPTPERVETSDVVCLLDRTLLETPLTIAAGDAGVLVYELKTVPEQEKTVSGVKIVSFEAGTDAEIGAMIDAAHSGTINLQTDANWMVGDKRKITIASFTDGKGTTHSAQSIDIVITSFDDYESCGCVLQFDFYEALATGVRMNSTNTTSGGYGGSEMYTATLPALVNALPSWLKNRLITFSVVARKGGSTVTQTETVSGNKLALRSAKELFDTDTSEGSHLPYYNSNGRRTKRRGYSGSSDYWWTRSAFSSSYFYTVLNYGNASSYHATNEYGVAPFGCI